MVSAKQPASSASLESLYTQLLEALMPLDFQDVKKGQSAKNVQEPKSANERTKSQQKKRSLEDKLADLATIEALNKQIEQTKTKRDKEKQFNRKRELNDQFKALKKQLTALHDG